MASIGDVFLRLMADDSQFAKDVEQKAGAAGAKAGQGLGQRMGSAATRALTGFGTASGVVFAGAIEGAVAFEDQLRTIQTVVPDIDISRLGDDIQALSRETGKTTDDLTAGFYDLVSAGVDADQAINVLRDSAKFATGALGSTAESVDLVTSVMNAYGLEAADSARITDVFAKAVADGKVTAAELGASIANIAPIASSAGVSMEEVSAGFAELTAKGVPAAQAATQMRAAISALLTPNVKLNEIQEQTGINFAELARSKGLAVALEELRKSVGGNAEEFGKALGSVEAYQFSLAVTGDQAENFANQIVETTNAAGIAQEQYDIKSQSAAEQGKRLSATFNTLLQDLGRFASGMGPVLFALNQFGQFLPISPAKIFGGILGGLTGKLLPKFAGALTSVFTKGGLKAAEKGGEAIADLTAKQISKRLAGTAAANTIGDGLSTGLTGAGKSGKVGKALGKLGDFMGSKLGKFLSVAFAAVAVIEVVNTYNEIRDGLNEQAGQINTDIANQLKAGTTESLEQSRAALEQGLTDLNSVWDLGIFTNEQRANLQAQLDATNAELANRAAGVGPTVADGVAGGAGAVTDAAEALVDGIPGAVSEAVGEAGEAAKPTAQEIADGILSNQNAVPDAMDQLRSLMEEELTTSQELWELKGTLMSDELIDAIDDKRPGVRAVAQQVRDDAEKRLAQLIKDGGVIGKKYLDELVAGSKSKDPDVRAAAQRVLDIVNGKLDELPPAANETGADTVEEFAKGAFSKAHQAQLAGEHASDKAKTGLTQYNDNSRDWGSTLISEYTAGIKSKIAALATQLSIAAYQAAKYLRLQSPAEAGPLSEGGGPEGWGERGAALYAKGWQTLDMDAIASRLAMPSIQPPSIEARLASVAPSVGPRAVPSYGGAWAQGGDGAAQPLIGSVQVTGGLPVETIRDIAIEARAVGERHRLPKRRRELLYPVKR